MTSTTLDFYVAARPPAPAAAAYLGDVFARLFATASPAARRARQVMREATHVRNIALHYEKTDPRFAAELYAAADRHEALYGE